MRGAMRRYRSPYVTPPGLEYWGRTIFPLIASFFADGGFYFVHVGSVFVHADGNHLDAEKLGDGEVAVVSGNRAEPRYVPELAPGLLAG